MSHYRNLWLGFVKTQSDTLNLGPRVCVFSSYGSPTVAAEGFDYDHKWMTGRSSISAYYIACLDQGPDIEDYRRYSLSFLRFIRRIPELTENDIAIRGLQPPMALPKSRFRLAMIINLDETPIPFQFTDNMTYNLKGDKTVSERSG